MKPFITKSPFIVIENKISLRRLNRIKVVLLIYLMFIVNYTSNGQSFIQDYRNLSTNNSSESILGYAVPQLNFCQQYGALERSGISFQLKSFRELSPNWGGGIDFGLRYFDTEGELSEFSYQAFQGAYVQRSFQLRNKSQLYVSLNGGYTVHLWPVGLTALINIFITDVKDGASNEFDDFYLGSGIGWKFDSGWFLEGSLQYSPSIKMSTISIGIGYHFEQED